MRRNTVRTLLVAALATTCLAPTFSIAQAPGETYYTLTQGSQDFREAVNRASKESKGFRYYFEHNYHANGHEQRWDRPDINGHAEHQGRRGQMSLKDAIQNLDEDLQRLRAEVMHRGRSHYAESLAAEIEEHANQVDQRMGVVAEGYWFNQNHDWKYDKSELSNRWQELKRHVDEVSHAVSG
jgi:hypothetical protein